MTTILIPNYDRWTKALPTMTLARVEELCVEWALNAAQGETLYIRHRYGALHAAAYAERAKRHEMIDRATYGANFNPS